MLISLGAALRVTAHRYFMGLPLRGLTQTSIPKEQST